MRRIEVRVGSALAVLILLASSPSSGRMLYRVSTAEELLGRSNGAGGFVRAVAGDTIEVAAGTYHLAGAYLRPSPGVTLSGAGATAVTILDGGINVSGDPATTDPLAISGLTLYGGVNIWNTPNVVVSDCEFYNAPSNGFTVWACESPMQVTVRNVTLRNCGRDGFSTKAANGYGSASLLTIENSRSLGTGPNDNDQNVTAHNGFPIVVRGGEFRDAGGSNIEGDGQLGSWIDVHGAITADPGRAGPCRANIVGRIVNGNFCQAGDVGGGICLSGKGAETYEATGNVVVGAGIRFTGATQVAIRGNYLCDEDDDTNAMVTASADSADIRNNLLLGGRWSVQLINTAEGSLVGNLFAEWHSEPLWLQDNGTLELRQNTLLGSLTDPLDISSFEGESPIDWATLLAELPFDGIVSADDWQALLNTHHVPEPASVCLLVLAGLLACRRRGIFCKR